MSLRRLKQALSNTYSTWASLRRGSLSVVNGQLHLPDPLGDGMVDKPVAADKTPKEDDSFLPHPGDATLQWVSLVIGGPVE
jgi:hypothetical protein